MSKANQPSNATDLIKQWEHTLEQFEITINPAEQFQDIKIQNKNIHTAIGEEIDWWPRSQIRKRTEILEDYGRLGPAYGWTTYKGTIQTAQYLWESKESLDKWAAIFILAFIKDLQDRNSFPDSWRGQRKILTEIQSIFAKENDYFFNWYFASRHALPVKITDCWGVEEVLAPKDINSFIQISAISAIITLSSYQLVRVIGVD